MRQIAVVGIGDQRVLLEYATIDGYHRFWPGQNACFVKEDPTIRPEIWTDLGDLLQAGNAPRLLRKRLDDVARQVATQGVAIRYFQQIGAGFFELPVSKVTGTWTSFWNHVNQRVIHYDEDGQVHVNDAGAKRLAAELQVLGMTDQQVAAVIEAGIATERNAQAGSWLRDHVIDFLVPRKEEVMGMVPFLIYACWVGLELGANTPLGEIYAGTDRGYIMLGITAVLIAFYFLRRRGK